MDDFKFETITGPTIKCACGFIASSDNQELNFDAFSNHNCPNERQESRIVGIFKVIFNEDNALAATFIALFAMIVLLNIF